MILLILLISIYQKLKKKLNIICKIVVDGAVNGLVLPFIKKNFFPLQNKRILAYLFDFHKAGLVPLSCGVVLYKAALKQYFESNIVYTTDNDATLLGSRPGAAAVSAYAIMQHFGKKGLTKLYKNLLKKKRIILYTNSINRSNHFDTKRKVESLCWFN